MNQTPLPSDLQEQAALLRQFAGRWVAVWKDAIVAASDSPDDLFEQLDKLGLPQASVRRIPDANVGVFVGLG